MKILSDIGSDVNLQNNIVTEGTNTFLGNTNSYGIVNSYGKLITHVTSGYTSLNIGTSSTDPTNGLLAADIYFNTVSAVIRVYNGTNWTTIGSDGGGSSSANGSQGSVQFNNSSLFKGSNAFIFDIASSGLTVGIRNAGTIGLYSAAFGLNNSASGQYSHAEGQYTQAIGIGSHAEGNQSQALGVYSHAEGQYTEAIGNYSHAEGVGLNSAFPSRASGIASHVEGYYGTASGNYSHAEGNNTTAAGSSAHAEGNQSIASGTSSHAEGYQSIASGTSSHAEGFQTNAGGHYSHAEGYQTKAYGQGSHAEGYQTIATGIYSHSEGYQTIASGRGSHAEGYWDGFGSSIASGDGSHAEGIRTQATGITSHAEGQYTNAYGHYSHAEGYQTQALGDGSHVEGYQTIATGIYSHVEGANNTASGLYTHAEGYRTWATGAYSHAGGQGSLSGSNYIVASGISSFNHSTNITSSFQYAGAGANYSAILGGIDCNINNSNTGAAIIGGNNITLGAGGNYQYHTAVSNLAIFNTPVNSVATDQVLAWNSTDKKVKLGTISSTSDIRLKTNIKPLTNVIDKIETLDTYEYQNNNIVKPMEGVANYGLTAQQVEKVFPNVVKDNYEWENEIYKTVDYRHLVPVLFAAIKELNERITFLENK
jgi:tetratricopeptide (TPR) repeat protein